MLRKRAFTLMELLIVVAIIAILVALAIPNLLNAQIRTKVTRGRSDLRTLAQALQAYHVDNNSYPIGNAWGVAGARPSIPNDPPVLERLSTPIAYLSQGLLPDVFVARKRSNTLIDGTDPIAANLADWPDTPVEGDPEHFLYRTYFYIATHERAENPSGITRVTPSDDLPANGFIVYSCAPMQAYINMGGVVANADLDYSIDLVYDPTNGTISFGNVFRGGGTTGHLDNIHGAIHRGLE